MIGVFLGLVVTCLILAPSTGQLCPAKKLLTFNAGLNPRVAEYDSRRHLVPKALLERKDDVMCLQEVWYEKDVHNILDTLQSTYPYHYSFIHHAPNQLRSKHGGWFSWLFGRFGTAPCVSRAIWPLGTCMVRKCAGAQGNALLGCLTQNCTAQIEAISQDCIACLLMSSTSPWTALKKCVNIFGYYNRMNGQGLLLLSKHPIQKVEKVLYVPGVKQMLARGFITADISSLGKVLCTHLTANVQLPYIEWNKDKLGSNSWEEQQLNEITKIRDHVTGQDHILFGDLNTGPAINKPGQDPIVAEYPANFATLLTYGYLSLYEKENGRCTWCSYNLLHLKPTQSKILDHIMLIGFTGRNATRTMGFYDGQQLSDHYGESLNICRK